MRSSDVTVCERATERLAALASVCLRMTVKTYFRGQRAKSSSSSSSQQFAKQFAPASRETLARERHIVSARANARRRCRDAVAYSDSDSALLSSARVFIETRGRPPCVLTSASDTWWPLIVLKIISKEGREWERISLYARDSGYFFFFSSLASNRRMRVRACARTGSLTYLRPECEVVRPKASFVGARMIHESIG